MSLLAGFLLFSGEGGGLGGGQNYYINQEVSIDDVVPYASIDELVIGLDIEEVSVIVGDIQTNEVL